MKKKIQVKTHHPQLSDKEAIAFAFKKANEADGDKFVDPDEFQDFLFALFCQSLSENGEYTQTERKKEKDRARDSESVGV